MYDLSSKFNTFYTSYVVLPQDEQNNLHNKKDLNVQRLKDGLKEYNIENNTSHILLPRFAYRGVWQCQLSFRMRMGIMTLMLLWSLTKMCWEIGGGTSYKKLSGKCTKTNGHWGQTPLNGTICLKWGECVN